MLVRSVHPRLLVSNYGECFRFYTEVMGLVAGFGNLESGYADFDTPSGSFSLFDSNEMAAAIGSQAPRADGGGQMALVFAVEDVESVYRELVSAGAASVAAPTDHPEWGIKTAHLRDPAGNLIEINQSL